MRDWRMGFLAIMLGMMALRQILTLWTTRTSWAIALTGQTSEFPGLIVSLMALLSIFFLERILTERKRAEEEKIRLESQLLRSQRLETIGTLAGGIAHDFNNLLTPIVGYTDMALSELKPTDPVHRNLQQVLAGASRAKELVEQILMFSRKVEKERRPLRLDLIVKEAVKLIRPAIPNTIKIQQGIDPACGEILADASQMHQVIVNLCTNAWQAMENKSGTISIELKKKKVGATTALKNPNLHEGDYACLSVIDQGRGMDAKTLDHIFEPFFSTKPIDHGTGLGLSVVQGIVQSHKGHIDVESQLETGTRVHIYLPIVKNIPQVNESEVVELIGGQESILVIDDDQVVATMIKKMLEELGYRVAVYENSRDALAFLKQHPNRYDLVLSDWTMPFINGAEFSEHVQAIPREIPVIIMTGYGDDKLKSATQSLGINTVLTKPLRQKDLALAIRRVLDQKSTSP